MSQCMDADAALLPVVTSEHAMSASIEWTAWNYRRTPHAASVAAYFSSSGQLYVQKRGRRELTKKSSEHHVLERFLRMR